jgi:hypothetical protein
VKTTIAMLIFLFALGAAIAVAGATNLPVRPGKYKLRIIYEIQGRTQPVSQKVPRCIGEGDLTSPESIFNDRASGSFNPDSSCRVKNLKYIGLTFSYDADCSNRFAHVEGTLGNTGFHVVRTIKTKGKHSVSFKLYLVGKREGDCKGNGG